jgi:hypothetical protein
MAKKAAVRRSAATAKFLSVSQADIEDHTIAWFVAKFGGTDPASLTAATDLKQRFNYTDPSWAAFAETLSAMQWMKQIGVRLAQSEMAGATTLGALVGLIWKKVPKLVAMSKLTAVTSLPKPKTT